MRGAASHGYLSLLRSLKEPYEELREVIDEMLLDRVRESIHKIQSNPKGDSEEEKEPDLKKQYEHFTREAKEVRKELEEALDSGG